VSRKQKPIKEGFPAEFRVQRIRVSEALGVADLPAPEIARYFREHPQAAKDLLFESYDKRFTPSTYITEQAGDFIVGWLSRQIQHQCVQKFSELADAATDYLLFSLGKGRWDPNAD